MSDEHLKQIGIRLPPKYYAALLRMAERETRSASGQVMHMIKHLLERELETERE